MPNDKARLTIENKNSLIKREIEYLHRQFPWKSQAEIASIFSDSGDVDKEALKKISTIHIAEEPVHY